MPQSDVMGTKICNREFQGRWTRSRSQLDITYQQQKCYKSGTDKSTDFKFGENYPRAEGNYT